MKIFRGNERLRGINEPVEYSEKELKEYFRCKEDKIYWCENYFHIISLDDGDVLFKPREYQRRAILSIDKNPDNLPHTIMLFPRQAGKTTLVSAYLLHEALFKDFQTIAIVANKNDTALEIMSRIRHAYENLPLWMQSGIKEFNKGSIEFENGSRIISSCTTMSAISGKSINTLYIDEMSKIPPNIANEFVSSTFPTLSSGKKTKIIITSTPFGLNLFWQFWKGAINKKNDFYPLKIHWRDIPGRDDTWREKELKKLNGSISKFNQEHECRFLGSSSTLVDPNIIEQIDPIEPIDLKFNDKFNIYEKPIQNALYFLGVDSGKGTGLDFSVVQVLKFNSDTSVEQVAVYRNDMINTHDFSEMVIAISKYYNDAMIMLENNDVGQSVADTIFYEFEWDYICNVDPKGLGIRSTKTSKIDACMNLKRYLEEHWLKINDHSTLYELSRFVEVRPNVFKAEDEEHDDTVMSLLWGLYVVKTVYYEGKIGNKIPKNYTLQSPPEDDDAPVIVFDEGNGFEGNDYSEMF